jgi:hypothetical protein
LKIEKKLSELSRFLDTVEDFLDRQAEQAESEEQRRQLEQYFPNLLRSSVFVTIYSAVENELNRLCRALKKEDGLELEDLRGSGIQRACTYLTRVCRVDFPGDSPEWASLQDFNHLRNIIVHNNGIGEGGNQFERLRAEYPELAVGKEQGIVLGREFCPRVLKAVEKFFHLLKGVLVQP